MRSLGRTQFRVVAAILVTAVIPLVTSILIARTIITRVSDTAFQPELGPAIDKSLLVYVDLVKAIKDGMKHEAEAISRSSELRRVAAGDDSKALSDELGRIVAKRPRLATIAVSTDEGQVLATRSRARKVDPTTERTLTVTKPLDAEGRRLLQATFATPSARFAEQENVHSVAQAYHHFENQNRTVLLDQTYMRTFSVLLLITIVVSVVLGVWVARPVTRGIQRLTDAMQPVAAGDLTVRVDAGGNDEVAELGRTFNRMLADLDESRTRVEFLRHMGEWQKMARRLAHEIKNPLTPIQLAVEECHRRYTGEDPAYQRCVQTTLEVVEEEVGSLRRLVTQFSSFARLPQAELAPADLAEFLRDQAEHVEATRGGEAPALEGESDEALLRHVDVRFDLPEETMPALLDREMLHRVLSNLITNAAQALRDARDPAESDSWGRVDVTLARHQGGYRITVDDDGPGVSEKVRETVFDPYVTTKEDGTGLGLSIVKKVVVDHGGRIEVARSPLGGARFAIDLPEADSAAARTAAERATDAADA